jgi:hypothetical protein
MKKILIFVLLSFIIALPQTQAYKAGSTGIDHKKLGLGLHLGEPLGANARYFFNQKFAADLTIGYGFGEEGFIIAPSGQFHFKDILDYDGDTFSLIPYLGAGLKFGVDMAGPHDGDGIVAVRLPVGAAFLTSQGKFEISVEVAPGVEFTPDSEFDITGGIGLRYYFW